MRVRAATILTVVLLLAGGAWAGTEKVLYSFAGGSDGASPYDTGLLVRDSSGNFYGTTYQGGSCGAGTVFELSSGGKETVLHNFCLGGDGGFPFGGVILDSSGNVYGTTEVGGTRNGGTVFELKRKSNGEWSESVLHFFSGPDGKGPFDGLIMDAAGNLYGTASEGGSGAPFGGVAYEISSSGMYSVIYNFCSVSGCTDGQLPFGGLTMDGKGNLYGTTSEGGASGLGTVFELSKSGSSWTETVLHNFAGGSSDGAYPLYGSPTLSAREVGRKTETVIFGVTTHGGASNEGTAFEIIKSTMGWTFAVLHNFGTRSGGASPYGTLVNVKSKLFGTTGFRGSSCCGTVFELTQRKKTWIETVLYNFTGRGDGGYPYSGVVADSSGNLYGVAYTGGSSTSGVVFKVKP
ncbi:MAG TPA: choice-of-anchor tandem repeat GloVer-containing protein [Terriglobales bacterium]|nr:choice-of-anchor tandem repeat GloVer-containing protein [Terriglobales bacterium]